MLLTGEPLSAEEAQRAGLINRVTAPGRERDEALALAKEIAAKSSHVVKIGKKAFYEQVQMPLAEAYDYAAKVMTENMMASDANEGICAFIEKRVRVGKTSKVVVAFPDGEPVPTSPGNACPRSVTRFCQSRRAGQGRP